MAFDDKWGKYDPPNIKRSTGGVIPQGRRVKEPLLGGGGEPAVIESVSGPSNGTYVIGQTLDFVVTFDKAVNVVTTGGTPYIDITLTTFGNVNARAAYASGTGTAELTFSYTVQNGDQDSNGIAVTSPITLNSGTIKDGDGTDAELEFESPTLTSVLVDGIPAAATSITAPSNGIYTTNLLTCNGNNLAFTVNFDKAVTVNTGGGTPYIDMTFATYGNSNARATYISGSGTTALLFRYTVQEADEDDNGIAATAITLNGGTITSNGGNATLTFSQPDLSAVFVYGIAATFSWFDANVSASVIRSGTSTSQWQDISGNARHTDVQSTGSSQATYNATGGSNNKAYLSGDGGDIYNMPAAYNALANGPNAIFAVAKRTSEDGTVDNIFVGVEGVTARITLRFTAASGTIAYCSRTTNTFLESSGNTNTNWQYIYGRRDGTTQAIGVNGGAETTNSGGQNEAGVDTCSIFSQMAGQCSEKIFFDSALNATQVGVVNRYLAKKYAI